MLTRGAKRKANSLDESSSYPSQIIIIRPGEKMKDKKGKDTAAARRAEYLKSFFTSSDNSFQIPNHIYTFKSGEGRIPSKGELLMEPLAHELGISINTTFRENSDERELITDIFTNCANQCVLICWDYEAVLSDLVPIIASTISADFSAFKSWNWDPREYRDNNPDLYSLIVIIDPKIQILKTANQDYQDSLPSHEFVSVMLP